MRYGLEAGSDKARRSLRAFDARAIFGKAVAPTDSKVSPDPAPQDGPVSRGIARDEKADKVLVVVPCLNEEAHLDRLIAQMTAMLGVDDILAIVDGGSLDKSVALAEGWAQRDGRVRVIANPRRIQSSAVNLAVDRYLGDRSWIVRADAHAEYPDNFIAVLLEAAKRTGAASVVVPMRTEGSACFQRAVAIAQNSRLGTGGAAHRTSSQSRWIDHGHHALFRGEVFKALNGYDETFTHNEDAEYDHRLTESGRTIWLESGAAITYYPRSSISALFRQYRRFGSGRAKMLTKHRVRPRLRQLFPAAVAPAVALLLLSSIQPLAAAPFLLWVAACATGGLAAGRRSGSTCGYAAGAAAMVMHLGWSLGFWAHLASMRRR